MCWWFSLVFPHIERWPRSNKHLFQHNGESKWATKKYGKQCKYINHNLSNLSPALDFWNPAVFIFCFSTWGLLPKEISRMLSFGKNNNIFLQIMRWDVKCPRFWKLNASWVSLHLYPLQVGRYLEGQWAQMLCDNNCWNSAWVFLLQMCRWNQLKMLLGGFGWICFWGLKSLE